MKIDTRTVRDVAVVSIIGRIPGENEKKQIQEVLDGLLAGGENIVPCDEPVPMATRERSS